MSQSHLPMRSKLDIDLENSLKQPEEEKKGIILSKNTDIRNLQRMLQKYRGVLTRIPEVIDLKI